MVAYAHLEVPGSPLTEWFELDLGVILTAESGLIVFQNSDGTETRLTSAANDFAYDAESGVLTGTISSMSRTDSGGVTTYETVSGLSLSAFSFHQAADNGARVALVFAGDDGFSGWSGGDVFHGGPGGDGFSGGGGIDTVSYAYAAAGVTADLGNVGNNEGEADGDTYTSIERLVGGDFDDVLRGNGGNNTLEGGAGDDFLRGRGGADALFGGAGEDWADYAGAGAGVTVNLASGGTAGDAAGDTYNLIERVRGTDFDDSLTGNEKNNMLRGGLGADFHDGGDGDDTADYSGASSGLIVSLANPSLNSGEAAGDSYVSIERLRGTAFNDHLIGDGDVNHLEGREGGDILDGGAGFDFARYTSADAAIIASLVNPSMNTGDAAGDMYISIEGLVGTSFADHLVGNDGDNFLDGAGGGDILDGGDGVDFARYQTASTNIEGDEGDNPVTASLEDPSMNTGDAEGDTYISIEGLSGSNLDDTLIGDANDNFLRGNLGADVLDGRGGFDFADYRNAAAGITVNLANPSANTGEAFGDTFTSIEGIRGGDFDDILIGDSGVNVLRGGEGTDTLDGGGDTDFADYYNSADGVVASLANPSVNTGEAAGDVYISIEGLGGSRHDDTLTGDSGNNFLRGREGADVLDGAGGFDFADYRLADIGLVADLSIPGNNTGEATGDVYNSIEGLIGSRFDDTLIGDGGNNRLRGGLGADALVGGDGEDWADYAQAAEDVIANLAVGGLGGEALGDTYDSIERLRGSDFNDTLTGNNQENMLRGGLGADALDGGTREDWADYLGAESGVVVNLISGGTGGEAAGDTYVSIERVRGTDFNDVIVGNAINNILRGGLGADVLDGGEGDDTADYREAVGGLTASLADSSINTGEAAGDTYISIERLRGTDFNDHLIGDSGENQLEGGEGADILDGGNGLDFARYTTADTAITANLAQPWTNTGDAAGDTYISIEGLIGTRYADHLIGDDDGNFLDGYEGADILDGGDGFDFARYQTATANIDGGEGDTGVTASLENPGDNSGDATGDTYISIEGIIGSNLADTLTGDANDNILRGNRGNDVLYGRAGNDRLEGGQGDDTLYGEDGDDRLFGGVGDDTLYGGDGDNILRGGEGNDTLVGAALSVTPLREFNRIDYRDALDDVTILLSGGTNSTTSTAFSTNAGDTANIGVDTLVNAEHAYGSAFDDYVVIDSSFSNRNGTLFEFEGGAGNDTFIATGEGRVGYATALDGVIVDLEAGTAMSINPGDSANIGIDTFSGVRRVRGSDFDDQLFGRDEAGGEEFRPRGGNDYIDGRGGLFDTLRYTSTTQSVIIDMGVDNQTIAATTNSDGFGGVDQFIGIENLRTGEGNDQLLGDNNNNRLQSWLGNDILAGRGGDDILLSEEGSDFLYGGEGSDTLRGGSDNDLLYGGEDEDFLEGGAGNDSLTGGVGFDTAVYSGNSSEYLITNNGDGTYTVEHLGGTGENGVDILQTVEFVQFDDTLIQLEGAQNVIIGSEGADFLFGTEFDDIILGLGGDDTIIGSAGNDVIDGGADAPFSDIVDYSNSPGAVTVNLTTGVVSDGWGTTDQLSDIEGIIDTSHDDHIIGNDASNWIALNAGLDHAEGGAGNDAIVYEWSSAGVTIDLQGGFAIDGDGNLDTILSFENAHGSSFNDDISLTDGSGYVFARAGDDVISARDGNDTIYGGSGNDIINGGAGNDTVTYRDDGFDGLGVGLQGVTVNLATGFAQDNWDDTDTLIGIERVIGSQLEDTIIGNSGDNRLTGSGGSDNLDGGGGTDTAVFSGNRSQYLILGTPMTFVVDDLVSGRDGTDTLTGIELVQFADGTFTVAELLGAAPGAPVITSNGGGDTAVIAVAENVTAVTTVQASDPDAGQTPTYAIIGGADAALFSIDETTGALSFIAAPDYEAPADADADNLYEVTVQASDGMGGVDNQTITVAIGNVGGQTFTGNSQANVLTGTAEEDTILGLNGADTISGLSGNDVILGGNGADLIDAGDGDDLVIYALGEGADTVNGGAGSDTLSILGTAANDTLTVTFDGGALTSVAGGAITAIETVTADLDDGVDRLNYGTTTADITVDLNVGAASGLTSITGIEQVTGGTGNDTLTGSTAVNTLSGGNGNDTFIAFAGDGDDVLSGGAGIDAYDLSATLAGATVTTISASSADIGNDSLSAIENIVGGQGNDSITMAAGVNVIHGGGGNDIIAGGAGNDLLYGGDDNDTFIYNFGDGADLIDGGSGTDTLQIAGNSAANTLSLLFDGTSVTGLFGGTLTSIDAINVDFGSGIDLLNYAGSTADVIVDLAAGAASGLASVTGVENVTGGSGNDTLMGDGAINTLRGGNGNDTYFAENSDVIIETGGTGGGIDTVMTSSASFLLSASVENLVFTGAGSFTGIGNSGANALTGGSGTDVLNGEGGADRLTGGAGDDLLNGGIGADIFVFGAGFGQDVIQDFAVSGAAHDIVEIDSDLFADFASLLSASTQNGADVVIAYDEGTSLTLEDVNLAAMGSSHFLFV
jgi:Ca2+-binding RTX toxin-like protein